MDEALAALQADVATCQSLENSLRGKPLGSQSKGRAGKVKPKEPRDVSLNSRTVEDVLHTCLDACKMSRKRHREESGPPADKSDAGLSQYTRFTDRISLDVYKQFLHYVPRLVNVVTVCHSCSPPCATVAPRAHLHAVCVVRSWPKPCR